MQKKHDFQFCETNIKTPLPQGGCGIHISLCALYCFISPSAITLSVSVMLINPSVEEINLGDVLLPAVIKILLNGYDFCHRLPQILISPPLWVLLTQNIQFAWLFSLRKFNYRTSASANIK